MIARRAHIFLACTVVSALIGAMMKVAPTFAQSSDSPARAAEAAPNAGPRQDAPPVDSTPAGNPLWAIPVKQLSATHDRPIFSPSRRPPPVAAPAYVAPVVARSAPKQAAPERPSIALVGTVAGVDEAIGVFVETSTRDVIRLRLGQNHKGWVLRSIKGREATLEKNSDTAVLALPPPGGGDPTITNAQADPTPNQSKIRARH
jgi:hypothetical protein